MILQVGKKYHIDIDDCCVQGEFESALYKIAIYKGDELVHYGNFNTEEQDDYGLMLWFNNGVYLEKQGGVKLTEI